MKLRKIFSRLFDTRAAGLYFLLFAASIGIATFIENDYGTSAAQKVIYKAWWFELMLLLFSGSIVYNVVQYRMVKQRKWSLILFHLSILVILLGAGLTRYLGFEGVMHIRENSSANSFLSADTHLKFEVTADGTTYDFTEPVLFASLGRNNFKESYLVGDQLLEVEVKDFIPNPKQELKEIATGQPILKLVVAGANGREEYFIKKGETRSLGGLVYNFKESTISNAINLAYENDALSFSTNRALTQTVMATQKVDTIQPSKDYQPLVLRALYSDGINNFVF